MTVLDRFELVYLHDQFLRQIHIDVQNRICRLEFDCAWILNDPPNSMFDCKVCFKPATLEFTGLNAIRFPEGYCLNAEVADSASKLSESPSQVCFSIDLMGGRGDDFMRTIEIIANDFSLSGTRVEFPPTDE